MYEEDRQTAISMYDRMFDNAEDEQALLNFLTSPTRQAVIIARSYNAKARKLSVEAQAGRGSADIAGAEVPEFVEVINEIHEDAMNLNVVAPEVSRDQISFFSEDKNPSAESFDPFAEFGAEPAPAAEPVPEAAEVPEQEEPAAPAEEEPSSEEPGQEEPPAPAEEGNSPDAPEQEGEAAPAAEPAPDDSSEHDEKIDALMGSFTFDEAPAVEKTPVPPRREVVEESELKTSFAAAPKEDDGQSGPNVLLLILYLIVSVPLTAIGIIILLVPALLFLALSVAVVIIASKAMAAAFGGFAVFSDVMVVLGASLVIMAVGLLLFWVFVWFLGGAIAGLINAVIRLGGKICYGEEK